MLIKHVKIRIRLMMDNYCDKINVFKMNLILSSVELSWPCDYFVGDVQKILKRFFLARRKSSN